jgi:hypothetical protein
MHWLEGFGTDKNVADHARHLVAKHLKESS